MPKKRAEIFSIWKEIMRELGLTVADLARETRIDYKWLKDFMNDETISLQTYNVKKIERLLKIPPLDRKRYDSGFEDINED